MAVSQMPNGNWRATLKHPETGKRVSAADVLGLGYHSSFTTERKALIAIDNAMELLVEQLDRLESPTVHDWWVTWTTDKNYQRPKESTNIHYRDRTAKFVTLHGDLRLSEVTDKIVAAWRKDGQNRSTLRPLRTMFNDAMSADAGRLVKFNPFTGLKLGRGRGRKDLQPPTEAQIWEMIGAARRLTPAGYAAWLQTACFTGMRCGELDSLRWADVDFDTGYITVRDQYNKRARKFTPTKTDQIRQVPMHDETRAALMSVYIEGGGEFCFTNTIGGHWTATSRPYHWRTVTAAAGWEGDCYLATRHFAGWMMHEVMGLDAETVGRNLGHDGKDAGEQVRLTYGHGTNRTAHETAKRAYRNRKRGDDLKAA